MIMVTGGNGMVGKSLRKDIPDAIYLNKKEFDLSNIHDCVKCFEKYKPKSVIHLAAKVGGISDNKNKQYDYYYDNVSINTNVIHCCHMFKVKKLIAMSSTCSYPSKSDAYPMKEGYVHDGIPEMTNLSYSYAKRMMQVQIESARKQFGYEWTTLFSGNLYGPNDSFDEKSCHVIPSLINKFHNTKNSYVDLLGTGTCLRQFTYVEDLTKIISSLIDSEVFGDFNFSYPDNISIKDLSEIIANAIGYEGDINFTGELDGVFRKDVDISLIKSVIDIPEFTDIKTGIKYTYNWYLRNKYVEINE